jgi:hypothetical protein
MRKRGISYYLRTNAHLYTNMNDLICACEQDLQRDRKAIINTQIRISKDICSG